MITFEQFVAEFGVNAYTEAVKMTVTATMLRDGKGAEAFAEYAQRLLKEKGNDSKHLNIHIKYIHHSQQRFAGNIGDYYWSDTYPNTLYICVTDTHNERMNLLLVMHELTEAMLCKLRGIPEPQCQLFDEEYKGNHSEPGNDVAAPYYREHQIGNLVENLLMVELAINPDDYEQAVNASLAANG